MKDLGQNFIQKDEYEYFLRSHSLPCYFFKCYLGFSSFLVKKTCLCLMIAQGSLLYKNFNKSWNSGIISNNDNLRVVGDIVYAPIYVALFLEKNNIARFFIVSQILSNFLLSRHAQHTF